jgi:uncharacterized membrane protein YfcA
MTWILAYLAAGTVIGFFAGLLGIGGGMTLVPILAALFTAQQMAPEHVMHLALGTAMAGVLFTGSASVREHHKLGSVDWAVVKRLAPPMATGTLLSALASGWLPQKVLALAFAVIVAGAATQIWIGKKPGPGRTLPGALGLWGVGLCIGVVSGLVSAGGAFLSMPFMLWCGVPVRTAIGTGAALGLPVAALGTLGYVASGWPASAIIRANWPPPRRAWSGPTAPCMPTPAPPAWFLPCRRKRSPEVSGMMALLPIPSRGSSCAIWSVFF